MYQPTIAGKPDLRTGALLLAGVAWCMLVVLPLRGHRPSRQYLLFVLALHLFPSSPVG